MTCSDNQTNFCVHAVQGFENGIVVKEGFSLAHADYVGHAHVKVLGNIHDLVIHLAAREVTGKARASCRAEAAPHGTASLRGEADRETLAIRRGDSHGLHPCAIGNLEEVLPCAVLGDLARNEFEGAGEEALIKLRTKALGYIIHVRDK